MYFSLLQGHGTSFWPGASGAPTLCMQGTTRFSSLSISAKTGMPMRAMMRMLTTTYGESVSCTPICDIGEPIGPMLNGSTYIVRPCMQPLNSSFSFLRISNGLTQLLVGPAPSFESEQMKVRSSTRATSLGVGAGVVAARPQLLVQLDEGAAVDHLLAQDRRILPASHPPSEWQPAW